MDSLHKISAELMKPVKNSAEWIFPMTEILDKYNETLVKNPEELKFGEAALVIQNCVSIYDKRVENLHKDTVTLCKSFQECEEQNELEKTKTKKERKKRSTEIDFENFEYVDFSQDVDKNINLKVKKEQREIKFLSPRYPQLEKCLSHKFSIEIFDVNGEVIGKKYDYLLNGHLTLSNMLVDDLTPQDFSTDYTEALIPESFENQEEILASSNNCGANFSEDFNDCEVFSPFAESGYGTINDTPSSRGNSFNESIRDDDQEFTESPLIPEASSDSGVDHNELECNILNSQFSLSDEKERSEASTSTLSSLKNSRTRESFETDAGYTSGDPDDANQISPEITNISEEIYSNMETIKPQQSGQSIDDKINNSDEISTTSEDNQSVMKTTESIQPEQSINSTANVRRSKRRIHNIIMSFEPIPPVIETPQTNKTEFEKPYNILTKKRKPITQSTKRKKMKHYLENSNDKTKNKKEKPLLLTNKLSEKIKKEIEELEKLLEKIYKNTNTYDAVGMEDLLGFKPQRLTNNSSINISLLSEESQSSKLDNPSSKEVEKFNKSTEDRFCQTLEAPCLNELTSESYDSTNLIENRLCLLPEASCSYTPPHSPDYTNDFDLSDDLCPEKYLERPLNHQDRIEQKMKKLQEDFDASNGRAGETARWLKTMEVLKYAEQRPIFHVHEYGNRIVKTLKCADESRLSFDDIVASEKPEDIARLFLASLHLANTHNVDIHVTKNSSFTNVDLRLISSNNSL